MFIQQPKDDRQVLEDFLVGNPELEELETALGRFNLFEALGAVRQELRHSDFLSFLMDPQQTHGLGESFTTLFLQRVVQSANLEELPVSAVDLHLWDMSGTTVQREWRNIDVLLLNEEHRLVVIVENKVSSGEHSDQLQRYMTVVRKYFLEWNVIGVYLTPAGEPASHEAYVPISYGTVKDVVHQLLNRRSAAVGDEVAVALQHYIQLLERHVVTESEIAELCRQIYRKHRRALDLIFEHRPDTAAAIQEILERLFSETAGIVPDQSTKSYMRFTLDEWDIPALKQGSGWTRSGHMLLFEFGIDYRGLVFHLVIGPGPLEIREKLFQAALNSELLAPSSSQLNKKWNDIWPNRNIIAAEVIEELTVEEIEENIRDYWDHFLHKERRLIPRELHSTIDEIAQADGG